MDWINQHFTESYASDAPPPLGALRAVLAAAERLGVAPNRLIEAAESGAGAAERAVLASLRPARSAAAENAFLERVRDAMKRLVDERRFGVDDVAKELAVSPRTLQRRLERSGTTFGELSDAVRRDAALKHLRNPSVPIKEAAFRLGFSEPSTFYRAFRRWTGDTPANYRRAITIF